MGAGHSAGRVCHNRGGLAPSTARPSLVLVSRFAQQQKAVGDWDELKPLSLATVEVSLHLFSIGQFGAVFSSPWCSQQLNDFSLSSYKPC